MSLETVIAENTAALRELLAALQAGAAISHAARPEAGKAEKAEPKATFPKLEEPAARPEAGKAEKAEPSPMTEAELGKTGAQAVEALAGHANKPEPAATYDDAKAAILRISKEKGREAAVAVLSQFGVQKLPDVKPENYAGVVAAVEAALGA